MSATRIVAKPNGPLVVAGPAIVVDAAGTEHVVEDGKMVGLCRCGASQRKPFCDASHRAIGFEDASESPGPA